MEISARHLKVCQWQHGGAKGNRTKNETTQEKRFYVPFTEMFPPKLITRDTDSKTGQLLGKKFYYPCPPFIIIAHDLSLKFMQGQKHTFILPQRFPQYFDSSMLLLGCDGDYQRLRLLAMNSIIPRKEHCQTKHISYN